jgi:hypothetical protein
MITISPLLFVIALVASALGGSALMADHKNAIIAEMKTNQAQAEAAVIEAAAERWKKAEARADTLVKQLAEADQARAKTALEHSHEIKKLSSGKPCFNAGLVRLLNQSGPRNEAPGLSASASSAAPEDGAFASDSDVAHWAANARTQYDTCRDRLGALIDFEKGEK